MAEKNCTGKLTSSRVAISVLCRTLKAATRAFEAMLHSGAAAADVSVIARGVEVDSYLVADAEMNANQLATPGKSFHPSALSRKLSGDRRLLIDGFWVAGPLFQAQAAVIRASGPCSLTDMMAAGGIAKPDVARIEADLETRGGVWLAVTGEPARAQAIERGLGAIEGAEILRGPPEPA